MISSKSPEAKLNILVRLSGHERQDIALRDGMDHYIAEHTLAWTCHFFSPLQWIAARRSQHLHAHHFDALLGSLQEDDIELARKHGWMTVTISDEAKFHTFTAEVAWDTTAIGQLAARCFRDASIKHVAVVDAFGIRSVRVRNNRNRAFLQAAREIGLIPHSFNKYDPVRQSCSADEVDEQLMDLLRALPKPVGVFMFNDDDAAWLLSVCRRHGVSVPDEVAIISVGDDANICAITDPPLTAVRISHQRIGAGLLLQLQRLLGNNKRGELPQPLVISPFSVSHRGSVESDHTEDPSLQRAMRLFRKGAKAYPSVTDMAKAAGISARELQRRFIAATGLSPKQWQLRQRLRKAQDLLLHSHSSIGAIAKDCGFATTAQFSHAFKKHHGTSPSVFRRGSR